MGSLWEPDIFLALVFVLRYRDFFAYNGFFQDPKIREQIPTPTAATWCRARHVAWYYRQNGELLLYEAGVGNLASSSTGFNLSSWRQVKIVVSGSSIKVYVDGNLEINHTDGTYTDGYFGFYVNGLKARFDGSGDPSGGADIYLNDHLGSARGMARSGWSANYYPFGEVASQTGSNVDTRFDFTGQERDEGTGLMYFWARYYDPVIGRFLGVDPLRNSKRPKELLAFSDFYVSPYAYTLNNPVNLTDPSGFCTNCPKERVFFFQGTVGISTFLGSFEFSPLLAFGRDSRDDALLPIDIGFGFTTSTSDIDDDTVLPETDFELPNVGMSENSGGEFGFTPNSPGGVSGLRGLGYTVQLGTPVGTISAFTTRERGQSVNEAFNDPNNAQGMIFGSPTKGGNTGVLRTKTRLLSINEIIDAIQQFLGDDGNDESDDANR